MPAAPPCEDFAFGDSRRAIAGPGGGQPSGDLYGLLRHAGLPRRRAEHDLAVLRADDIRLDHAGGVDDGIDHLTRAAAAVSSTRPPFALSLPSLVTSDFSVCPVATSFTCVAIWSPTPSVISLSP